MWMWNIYNLNIRLNNKWLVLVQKLFVSYCQSSAWKAFHIYSIWSILLIAGIPLIINNKQITQFWFDIAFDVAVLVNN